MAAGGALAAPRRRPLARRRAAADERGVCRRMPEQTPWRPGDERQRATHSDACRVRRGYARQTRQTSLGSANAPRTTARAPTAAFPLGARPRPDHRGSFPSRCAGAAQRRERYGPYSPPPAPAPPARGGTAKDGAADGQCEYSASWVLHPPGGCFAAHGRRCLARPARRRDERGLRLRGGRRGGRGRRVKGGEGARPGQRDGRDGRGAGRVFRDHAHDDLARAHAGYAGHERREEGRQRGLVGQRGPRTVQQRLDRGHRRRLAARELLVAAALELAPHERGALGARQALDRAQRACEALALFDDLEGRRRAARQLGRQRRGRLRRAKVVVAAVAHDREQPRLDVDRHLAADDRAMRAHEPVLDGVLGQAGVASTARRRVADESRAVAGDELGEGRLVAAGGGEQEGVVGALSHQEMGRTPQGGSCAATTGRSTHAGSRCARCPRDPPPAPRCAPSLGARAGPTTA